MIEFVYLDFQWYFPVLSKKTVFFSCPSSHVFLVGWEWLGLKLKDCLKSLVSETKTISRLPVSFLVNLLSFLGKVFFTVRITKSGPKSRENSIALLETEKVILLKCRLKVYKMKLEMRFRVAVATIGKSTRLCSKCILFLPFLVTSSCMLDCD